VDVNYLRVIGLWFYLYRAIDSAGATMDFLLHCAMPMPPNGCSAVR
jgi:transposase-like protein